jgi:hypothetical protein
MFCCTYCFIYCVRRIFNCSFSLKMDVSNDNDNNQQDFVCQKIGSSSESSSDVGEIIKVMRGLPTLRNASAEFVYAHSTCRQKYIHNKYFQIQIGNFKWNKIHNLDIGTFCKKIPKQVDFCFSLPTFWRIWFLHICSRKFATPLTYFFKWKGMPSDTSFERLLVKEYNAPFVSLIFSKLTC